MEKGESRLLEEIFRGATFDDFLFRPQHSVVDTRRGIDLTMPLTRGISIKVPIVGANMDTVTREKMAKTLALEGCFGFLDRNCSISDQVARVEFVKRQHSFVIEDPITIHRRETIRRAKELIKKHNVSGILARESSQVGRLIGVLSHRDILAAGENDGASVWEFMTPFEKLVTARPGISLEEAEKLMLGQRVEKLPLIDGHRRIRGLITLKDVRLAKQKPYSIKDKKGRLVVGAAIGARGDYLERAEALIAAGADCILIDIAHADSEVVNKALKAFRAKFKDIELVCGNIATRQGARFLAGLGVDAVKVGVGPGRGCRTRLETGAGVPQLQAIREVFLEVGSEIPVIADGGMKNDKDFAMAFMCGASTAMVGGMLSGTDEAPGLLIEKPTGEKKKVYRGMTSPEAVMDSPDGEESLEERFQTPAEGQSLEVDYSGSVVNIIRRIRGHLQSAVSYAGQDTLLKAHKKISLNPGIYLERLTEASRRESFER